VEKIGTFGQAKITWKRKIKSKKEESKKKESLYG